MNESRQLGARVCVSEREKLEPCVRVPCAVTAIRRTKLTMPSVDREPKSLCIYIGSLRIHCIDMLLWQPAVAFALFRARTALRVFTLAIRAWSTQQARINTASLSLRHASRVGMRPVVTCSATRHSAASASAESLFMHSPTHLLGSAAGSTHRFMRRSLFAFSSATATAMAVSSTSAVVDACLCAALHSHRASVVYTSIAGARASPCRRWWLVVCR